MLIENMKMAFSAIRSNKMHSALTMLGIIIGIGSVIAIVSIGDIMRRLFSGLYKDVGITQAYVSTGYRVDGVWQSGYFNLDEMERARGAFKDQVAYIDSSAFTSSGVECKRTKIKFDYQGTDYNYQDVQPVNVVYGRYLNEGDVLGRRKNVVMDTKSAQMLFGTENAVGWFFRATLYDSTDDFMVAEVYYKETNALRTLMMGGSDDKGSAFIPYTLLIWPNDNFYQLHVYAKEDVNLGQFFSQFKAHAARMHDRQPEDTYMYMVMQGMTSIDSMMGNLPVAVDGIAAILLLVGGTGITNIMPVSVTECTREIGIRKALGARTRGVLIQFSAESVILSACGGIIGVILGVETVPLGGFPLGFVVVIKPVVIIATVSSSAVVGISFGLYPASKTAQVDPIDTLRYEQLVKKHRQENHRSGQEESK